MKKLLLFSVVLLAFEYSTAQKVVTTYNEDSTISVTKDPRFDQLIDKQKKQNQANPTMPGYRIQIYFGGVRQKATEVKLEIQSKYPGVPAYLTYAQPNFKVRIGDYRNRFEAQKFLKEIEGMFPTSFIVPEDVKLPAVK